MGLFQKKRTHSAADEFARCYCTQASGFSIQLWSFTRNTEILLKNIVKALFLGHYHFLADLLWSKPDCCRMAIEEGTDGENLCVQPERWGGQDHDHTQSGRAALAPRQRAPGDRP